ncbi:MAG: hypothetical protein PHX24_01545 [Acidithiobacillus sp.]|nr:hypothetical protein [Acidithiobacillus sp.]
MMTTKMMILMMILTAKMAVAITEHPTVLFDALHEQGESSEVLDRTRAGIAFFALIKTLRAIRWMAEQVFSTGRVASTQVQTEPGSQGAALFQVWSKHTPSFIHEAL